MGRRIIQKGLLRETRAESVSETSGAPAFFKNADAILAIIQTARLMTRHALGKTMNDSRYWSSGVILMETAHKSPELEVPALQDVLTKSPELEVSTWEHVLVCLGILLVVAWLIHTSGW
jgi:hypothetical protein